MEKLNLDKFDIVMCMGVLHHLSDDLVASLCAEAERVLKPDGYFLSLEPCWTPTQSWLNRTIMSLDRGENIRFMEGYTDLLKRSFRESDAREIDTADVIFPTCACAIRAAGVIPA